MVVPTKCHLTSLAPCNPLTMVGLGVFLGYPINRISESVKTCLSWYVNVCSSDSADIGIATSDAAFTKFYLPSKTGFYRFRLLSYGMKYGVYA